MLFDAFTSSRDRLEIRGQPNREPSERFNYESMAK
jgi:hypothetical protein